MTVTRFAVGLLLISSVNAFFRLPCSKPVLNARVDPIVNPGKASGHAHTIMGSGAIGYNTTFQDLRNSDCSTCKVKDDHSAYWIPELYYQYKNGSFQGVDHGGMLVYYLQRSAEGETVQAFPDGLRMLTGNPFARSNAGTPESKAITWNCIDFNGPAAPQTPGFANTHCPNGLRAQVFFPSCWDGQNLDSSDHKSHMAYPDGVDNGRCPSSHPVHLISIFYEVYFAVASFNALNDGGRFVLSNGDPTGYGLHGDFQNGWDHGVLSRAVATCTAASGVIEDCPVFQNEGRFYADSAMNSCAAKNPMPDEPVGPGALMSHLPGCIAVTEGPAPATPADVVPGCVAGSGSPAPSSPAPGSSSASSSSSTSSAAYTPGVAKTSTSTTPTQSPTLASQSQASSHSSSGTPAMNSDAQPTTITTQTKSTPSPTLSKTSGAPGAGAGVPSGSHVSSPVPSPSASHYEAKDKGKGHHYYHHHKPTHHGHGHGHQEEEDGCGDASQSAHRTSSTPSHDTRRRRRRRRHMMKHGYRSPAHF